MADEHPTNETDARSAGGALTPPPRDPRNAIVDALLELAGERVWEDITISDIAARANIPLSVFRDCFPSKGAVLSAFLRRINSGSNRSMIGSGAILSRRQRSIAKS